MAEQWMDRELYQMNNDCFQLCRVFNFMSIGRALEPIKSKQSIWKRALKLVQNIAFFPLFDCILCPAAWRNLIEFVVIHLLPWFNISFISFYHMTNGIWLIHEWWLDRIPRNSKFLFLNLNCHFRWQITKIIVRVNSHILTSSPYLWIFKYYTKITIIWMAIFSKISKIIYRMNNPKFFPQNGKGSWMLIFFWNGTPTFLE